MQKITPCLWFSDAATLNQAIDFYTSLFPESKTHEKHNYTEIPGPVENLTTVIFELAGQRFMAFNGGAGFKFTPALSFTISCQTENEIDQLWQKLSQGGQVLMELGAYPFSKKYGWANDKFGVSWQLNLTGEELSITPSLLFVSKRPQAEQAIKLYTSLFPDSKSIELVHYQSGDAGGPIGGLKYATFTLAGQRFITMDSDIDHKFSFSEAVSLYVSCKDQSEVDALWQKLTADGGEESQCGWLKDKFGVSWQIIPQKLEELINHPDRATAQQAMAAMLKMGKIEVDELERAVHGSTINE